MTDKEALKLALEAIEELRYSSSTFKSDKLSAEAITAIKEALDECDEDELIIRYHEATIKRLENRIDELMAQPSAIPIGYWHYGTGAFFKGAYLTPAQEQMRKSGVLKPVYTAPQQRPWEPYYKEALRVLSLALEEAPQNLTPNQRSVWQQSKTVLLSGGGQA